jgi:DNA-binding LacI/PurR family transcriptional regulator
MAKIICGFAGIGKSNIARNNVGFVDLESTPFEKDWNRYVKVAEYLSNNGYTVLLSCHKELREELRSKSIDYLLAIPKKDKKAEYLQRYKKRGDTANFINLLDSNWESFLSVLPNENVLIVDDYLELKTHKLSTN